MAYFEKIKNEEFDFGLVTGTSKKGEIEATYDQLVKVLGEPTLDEERDPYSGDGKTNVEWVFRDLDGEHFTIYDWKTYDINYTKNKLNTWSVGSKVSPFTFIVDFVEAALDRIR